VVERSSGTHARADGYSHADGAGEGIVDTQEGFGLVGGTVFVYGHEDVLVSQDRSHAEEGRKEVWDNIERVVEVDSKEVLVPVGFFGQQSAV